MVDLRSRRSFASIALGGSVTAAVFAGCTLRSLEYLTSGGADAATQFEGGDASPDAADAPDAPNAPWCTSNAPTAVLCADFDEGALTKAYHLGNLVTIPSPTIDPGCAAMVGMVASSPPGAFATKVPPIDDGGTLQARYEQPLAGPPASHARLQLDVMLVTYTPGQEVDIAAILLGNADGGAPVRAYLSIDVSGMGLLDSDRGGPAANMPFAFPADGNWHTYSLDVDVQSNVTASLRVDDPMEKNAPVAMVNLPGSAFSASESSIEVGNSVYGPSQEVDLDIDNVAFTTQ